MQSFASASMAQGMPVKLPGINELLSEHCLQFPSIPMTPNVNHVSRYATWSTPGSHRAHHPRPALWDAPWITSQHAVGAPLGPYAGHGFAKYVAERHADLTNMPPSPPSTVDNNDGERQEDEDHDMFILPPARSPSSADPSAHAQNEKRRRDQENIILADAEAAMIRCLPGSRLDKQEKKVTKIDRLQLLQTGCHRVERIKYALEQVYRENGGPPGIGRILNMFEI